MPLDQRPCSPPPQRHPACSARSTPSPAGLTPRSLHPSWLLPHSDAQQRTLLESRYVRSLLDLLDGVTRTVRLRKQLAPAQVGTPGEH